MPTSSSPGAVSFAFSRDATENGTVDVAEQFGFRLRNATIEIQLGAGNWQALTDDQTLRVATFTLSPQTDDVPLGGFCTKPCPPGLSTCPRQRLRRFVIDMSGVSALDTRVVRQLRTEVKLRNDAIEGACPA